MLLISIMLLLSIQFVFGAESSNHDLNPNKCCIDNRGNCQRNVNPSIIGPDKEFQENSCSDNEDCGSNAFTGEEYCVGNDIYKDFKDYMCVNPGTASSSCDSDTTPQLIKSCAYACSDGGCVRCDADNDCNDNNANTSDVCLMPGSVESHCQNNVINTCQDECVSGSKMCVGNGYKVCGDGNGDGCSEWSGIANCGYGKTCQNGTCVA